MRRPNVPKCFFAIAVLALTSCTLFNPTPPETAENNVSVPEQKKDFVPYLRRRVLVANFVNKSRYGGEELIRYSTRYLRDFLLKYPEYSIVSQDEIPGAERFVNEFGEFSIKEIVSAARAQNISGIVLGTISDLSVRQTSNDTGLFRSREYTLSARVKLQLIDTGTEREIFSQSNAAEINEEHTDFFRDRKQGGYDAERGKVVFQRAMEKPLALLPDLLKKIAWVGRIAKVEQRRYYINAGEMTGISRGHLLKVYGEGQLIRDPDTKEILGLAPGPFKGILKVVDYFGLDGSIAIIHSGGGFKERDRVELYIAQKNKG